MYRILTSLLLLILSANSDPCFGQPITKEIEMKIDTAIEAERQKQQVASVAIGLIREGKIVFAKTYGYADVRLQRKATNSTVYNWTTTSGSLMATLALKLAERKQLNIDADIRQYIKYPAKHGKITTRQLLCHQGGIPHYDNGMIAGIAIPVVAVREMIKPITCVERFAQSPLLFPPGTKSSYSSYGYILLTAVVESAGRNTITNLIKKEIVGPLKLRSFTMDFPQVQRNWATGYEMDEKTNSPKETEDYPHYWKHGAGGYKSNIVDYVRWADALLNEKVYKNKETMKEMMTVQKLKNGSDTDWGLGIHVSRGRNFQASMIGIQSEATSMILLYPGLKIGMVVMSNSSYADCGEFSSLIFKAIQE